MNLPSGHLISVGDRVFIREGDDGYSALLVDVEMDGTKDTVQLDNGDIKIIDRSKIFPKNYKKIMEYKEIKDELNIGICEITFTKKDGTERIMSGTLNFDHIPQEKHPKQKSGEHQTQHTTVTVFDVIKEDWRSFRVDSIIDFTRLTGIDKEGNNNEI
jgi:hypothetical protein